MFDKNGKIDFKHTKLVERLKNKYNLYLVFFFIIII